MYYMNKNYIAFFAASMLPTQYFVLPLDPRVGHSITVMPGRRAIT